MRVKEGLVTLTTYCTFTHIVPVTIQKQAEMSCVIQKKSLYFPLFIVFLSISGAGVLVLFGRGRFGSSEEGADCD